jgi:hypothetical protein
MAKWGAVVGIIGFVVMYYGMGAADPMSPIPGVTWLEFGGLIVAAGFISIPILAAAGNRGGGGGRMKSLPHRPPTPPYGMSQPPGGYPPQGGPVYPSFPGSSGYPPPDLRESKRR